MTQYFERTKLTENFDRSTKKRPIHFTSNDDLVEDGILTKMSPTLKPHHCTHNQKTLKHRKDIYMQKLLTQKRSLKVMEFVA